MGICFITVIILAVVFLDGIRKNVNDNAYHLSKSQMNDLVIMMEDDFNKYFMQLENMQLEPDIKRSLNGDTNAEEEKDIHDYLTNVAKNDSIVDYICFYKNGKIESACGNIIPGEKEKKNLREALTSSRKERHFFTLNQERGNRLYIFLMEEGRVHDAIPRGIGFSIDLNKYKERVPNIKAMENIFMVFSSADDLLISNNLLNHEEMGYLRNYRKNSIDYEGSKVLLGDNTYFYSSSKSEILNLTIVMLRNAKQSASKIEAQQFKVVFHSIIVLIFAFIFSLYTSNRIYKQRKYMDDKLIESEKLIEDHKEALILRYFVNNDEVDKVPDCLRHKNKEEQSILIMCSTRDSTDKIREISDIIAAEMSDFFTDSSVQALVNEKKDYLALFFKESKEVNNFADREKIKETLLSKVKVIEAQKNITIYSSVSHLILADEDFKKEYYKAYTFSKYNLFRQCKPIMDNEDFADTIDEEIPKKKYSDILASIRETEPDRAITQLIKLIDSIKGYEIKRALLFLAELCGEIDQITCEFTMTKKQSQELFIRHYIRLIEQSSYEQMLDYIKKMITGTCAELEGIRVKSMRMKILDSMAYIQDHYMDSEIGVEQVADYFHLSVSYYSRLFNESAGMTFPEAINELRLESAKELLLHNQDMSIKSIAEKSGFSSVSYFSAQFKKKYGISPTSYRGKR